VNVGHEGLLSTIKSWFSSNKMPDFEDEVEFGLADDKTFYDVIVASNKSFHAFDYGLINNLKLYQS